MLAAIARAPGVLAGRRRAARNPEVLFEFFGASGTPDVVFLEFDEDEYERRERLGLGPVRNYGEVDVLLALRDRSLSVGALSQAVGLTPAHLRRATLPVLRDAGWVESNGRECSALQPIRPLARWIVAVEAKRRDWRRALDQATRYRRFANRAVVVLDATANLDAARQEAEIDGALGLVSVDAHRQKLRRLVLPRWHAPSSFLEFVWAGEQAYLMRRTGAVSGPVVPVFGRMLVASDGNDPRLAPRPTSQRQIG